MDHFTYQNGVLFAEDVKVSDIVSEVGTPFYCYSTATIERHYTVLANALSGLPATICYAVKANSNLAVLGILAQAGAGFDIVSRGELKRVLAAGGQAGRVVYSGVGKTYSDIEFALQQGIGCFNVESISELSEGEGQRRRMRADSCKSWSCS